MFSFSDLQPETTLLMMHFLNKYFKFIPFESLRVIVSVASFVISVPPRAIRRSASVLNFQTHVVDLCIKYNLDFNQSNICTAEGKKINEYGFINYY